MARLQQTAGGAFGLGGTLAARQFLDQPGQNRFTQPSVLFGLGTGVLASALWYTGLDTVTPLSDEFWGSHAMSSIPTGMFFLAFPKQANQGTVEQVQEALNRGTASRGGTGGGGGTASSERATVRRESSDRRAPSA